jgi:hypothetical protein
LAFRLAGWRHEPRPSRPRRPGRRRHPVGVHRARHQDRGALPAARLADRGALRPGRAGAADRPPLAPAGRLQPGRAGLGRRRLRRHGLRAERRGHADQRQPRGAAGRGHAGAGRGHRRAGLPHRGPPRGLAGLRGLAGRGRPGGRGGRPGRREHGRRRPGPGLAAAVRLVHRGPDPAAARPRPGRGHRRADAGRHAGHAARGRPDRGTAPSRDRGRARAPRHHRPGAGRDAAPVHPVRLRPVTCVAGRRRAVPEPGAAGRRGHRHRVLRRPAGPGPGRRGGGHPGRDRGQQPALRRPGHGQAAAGRGSAGARLRAGTGRPACP